MAVRLLVGAAAVALVLAVAACGDGDGDGGDAAETPEELASCLQEGGYATEVTKPAPGEPGEGIGVVGGVEVRVGQKNAVIATFFDAADQAESYNDGQVTFLEGAGAGGSSELVTDTVVVGYVRSGADEELEAFRSCLEGAEDRNGSNREGATEAPEELAGCLEAAGYTAEVDPPSDPELGDVGVVYASVDSEAAAIARFFDDAGEARDYLEGAAAFLEGAGTAEAELVVGTVVVGLQSEVSPDFEAALRACLES